MSNRLKLLLLFCCLWSNLQSQMLSKTQMLKDMAKLETDLLEIHPGLGFYSSTADLPGLFEQMRERLPDSLSIPDFLVHLAPAIDSLKCGHTGFNLYSSKFLKKNKFKGLIPLHLVEVESKILIRRNMSNDTLNILPKCELLEINQVPVMQILKRLTNIGLGSDGNNQAGKLDYALRNFRLAYRKFYGERDSFDLVIRQIEKDSIVSVRIAGKSIAEMTKTIIDRYKLRPVSAFKLRPIKGKDNVAILDINRFSSTKFDPFHWGFRRKLKGIFKTIRKNKIDNLIIDLRNNPGGLVENVVLLQKLVYSQPFVVMNNASLNRKYFKSNASFSNKLTYWLRGTKKKEDDIRFRPFSGKKHRPKKNKVFSGNLIVLINEGSFSAACTFSLFAKSKDRAILIGEEAGGSYHIVSAGSSYISKLKYSKLNVRIPVVRFDYNVRPELQSRLHGVTPDIEVLENVSDYLNGIDTQLDFAIELIDKFEKEK